MAEIIYHKKYSPEIIAMAVALGILFLLVTITVVLMLFPVEAGFHDSFHEYRHALGIACH